MKSFVIETRKGFVSLPEIIGAYHFPISFGSIQASTHFPFKTAAERMIRKYKLKDYPYFAHVEEYEE